MGIIENLEKLCKLQNKNTQLVWRELQKLKQAKPKKKFKFTFEKKEKSHKDLVECKNNKCPNYEGGFCNLKGLELCEEKL